MIEDLSLDYLNDSLWKASRFNFDALVYDEASDKIVTLEVSDGVKLKMLRGQVAGKSEAIFSANKTEK